MPKYRVKAPNGLMYEVDAPDGATEQQAIAYVKSKFDETAASRKKAGDELKQEVVDTAKVPLIAAGRQGDKLVQGLKELALGANVAGREALGMQSGDQLRQMAKMDAVEEMKDSAYQPLKEKHPFLTGMGEGAYLAGAPVGQASALARVAAPALTAAATEALSFGNPQERALRAGEKGLAAGVGGAGGEVVRGVIAPARSNLTAAQQQAVQRASQNIGYKPRASDLTGNETLRRLEDSVARQPGGAGPMREFMDQNDRAVARHAAKAMGEDADAITAPVFAAANDRIKGTYDDLRSRAQMPVVQDVFDAVQRAEKMLTKGDASGPKKTAFETIQRLKDQLYQSKQFDGETYQAWTSDLGAQAKTLGKESRTAAAALREVEKAMDKVARGADAPAWMKADKEYAAMETLMKPRVVNTETGKVSPLHVASQMEQQFGKNLKTGKVTGELADIAALARAMPPMREGSQTAGREAFGGLPGWMMAGPNYAASKALTSEFGRDYLSKGLLGNPAVSKGAGGLLGRGAIPLTLAEIEALLLGYQ
jgi:hypothetical protein